MKKTAARWPDVLVVRRKRDCVIHSPIREIRIPAVPIRRNVRRPRRSRKREANMLPGKVQVTQMAERRRGW